MKVLEIVPRGFCKGVVSALNLVDKTIKENPNTPIYVLGMIVHNKHITEDLRKRNVHTIDDKNKSRLELLDQIDHGIVIFSAHGISDAVKEKAIKKNLQIVDGSCVDVLKTQEYVKQYLSQSYEVIYIGKHHHPEAEAVVSINPSKIHLIEKMDEIDLLNITSEKILITNQTTMSLQDIYHLTQALEKKYPHSKILEEVCNATRVRQQAILDIEPSSVDALFIVGDIRSNNTNNLASIALNHGIKHVYRIETKEDINTEDLKSFKTVAVTSGASTPTYLTNQVIEYLKEYTN